jgi:hypothetical protein
VNIVTEWQLKWCPVALLMTLAFVCLVFVYTADQTNAVSGKLGGDFPAFYGAGRIVLEGDIHQLYTVDRQIEAQKDLMFASERYMCFAYPPFVAIPYALLAMFPYKVAYLIHLCLMLLMLLGVLKILFREYKVPDRYFLLSLSISLSFYPLLKAFFGGQNTLLTLLLLCLFWSCVDRQQNILAGLFLGFMLFKPQFAVPMIALILLSRRWIAAVSSLGVGAGFYLICAFLLGPDWFAEWLDFALWFSQTDAQVNAAKSISWVGLMVGLFGSKAYSLGIVMSVVNAAILSVVWFKEGRNGSISKLMPMTCISLALIPERVMFYDSGLLLVAGFMLATINKSFGIKTLILVWMAACTQTYALNLGFSPISLVMVGVLVISMIIYFRENRMFESLSVKQQT